MTTYAADLQPTDKAFPPNQGKYSVEVYRVGEPLELLHVGVLPGNSTADLEFYLRGKSFAIEKEIEAGKRYTLVKTD